MREFKWQYIDQTIHDMYGRKVHHLARVINEQGITSYSHNFAYLSKNNKIALASYYHNFAYLVGHAIFYLPTIGQ